MKTPQAFYPIRGDMEQRLFLRATVCPTELLTAKSHLNSAPSVAMCVIHPTGREEFVKAALPGGAILLVVV
jgi:hypothetical protein